MRRVHGDHALLGEPRLQGDGCGAGEIARSASIEDDEVMLRLISVAERSTVEIQPSQKAR